MAAAASPPAPPASPPPAPPPPASPPPVPVAEAPTPKQQREALIALLRNIATIGRQQEAAQHDRTDAERVIDKCGAERATLERDVLKLGFAGRTFLLDDRDGKPPLVIIVHAAAVELREAERI